jgi:formate dehydrogenase subunit gamma
MSGPRPGIQTAIGPGDRRGAVQRHEPFSTERTIEIATALAALEGPLLPILHEVQEAFGHVPEASVPVIADVLNLTRAEVHGVVSFYHDFRRAAPGRHVVKLCRAEACQSMGGDALAAHAERCLGVEFGGTRSDGRVTLEPVYCLGLCATAPSAMVDGRVVGRLDAAAIERIAAEVDG